MPVPGQWAMLKATYKAPTIYRQGYSGRIDWLWVYKAYKLIEVSERLEIHISEGRVAYQTTCYAKMQKTCMFAQIRTPREGLCQEPSDCTILNGSARKMTTTNEIEKFWKHIRSGHRKQQRKSGGCPWSMCCLGLMSCHFGEIVSYQGRISMIHHDT